MRPGEAGNERGAGLERDRAPSPPHMCARAHAIFALFVLSILGRSITPLAIAVALKILRLHLSFHLAPRFDSALRLCLSTLCTCVPRRVLCAALTAY